MSEINEKCLEMFPSWLRTLDEDADTIIRILESEETGLEPRRYLAGGINYLFKSLDLIPDGIDDIGYLDDAFILRLAAQGALEEEIGRVEPDLLNKLGRLASDCELIEPFLEKDVYDRLSKYVRDLRHGAARGRTVDELLGDKDIFKEFAAEVSSFVKEYSSPGFTKDEKNLIKLKAFFEAKLPK